MTEKYKGIVYANARMFLEDYILRNYDPKKGWFVYDCSLVDHGPRPEDETEPEEGCKVIASGDSERMMELHTKILKLMYHAYRRGYNAALEAAREESETKAS